jgi:hypothetical protein
VTPASSERLAEFFAGLADADLSAQIGGLAEALHRNRAVSTILELAPRLGLPHWYLGAGCIAQTVWNLAHREDAGSHVRDHDLVYFDDGDLSYQAEDRHIERARRLFRGLPTPVEVRNQARVHLWYERRFGVPIEAFRSCEEAIRTWPTTATAMGVRKRPDGSLVVCAPFGLSDLFGLVVRPNRLLITEEIYREKVARWIRHWPRLRVVPWDEGTGSTTEASGDRPRLSIEEGAGIW